MVLIAVAVLVTGVSIFLISSEVYKDPAPNLYEESVNIKSLPSMSPNPYIKPSEYDVVVYDCGNNTYEDVDFGFSIECPQGIKMYTVLKRPTYYGLTEKISFLCETEVEMDENGYYKCPGGGIEIWANGDGWGDGCDAELHTTLVIDGEAKNFCLGDSWFSQLSFGTSDRSPNQNAYLLTGNFSENFAKEKALVVLKSLKGFILEK